MKLIKLIVLGLITSFVWFQSIFAQNTNEFYYETTTTDSNISSEQATDLAKVIKEDNIESDRSLLTQIRGFFQLNGDQYKGDEPALDYVKMLLNMALWFVSFISLVLVIVAFYLIFFSKWEDGVKKAKAILKWGAIAIVLMSLSRIIVSFFFSLYTTEISQ